MFEPIRRLCFSLAMLSVSCASGAADFARDRASREYDCPPDQVEVRWLSGWRDSEIYAVDACGNRATYECDKYKGSCVREASDD